MSRSHLHEIAQLKIQLSEFSDDYRENEDDEDRQEEFKATLLELMRSVVGVVDDSQREKAENMGSILEQAESLLNDATTLAYEGAEDGGDLFASLDSFADTSEYPKIERPREGEGVFRE